jgi:chemotaxis protein histidine kinase CheA
MSYSQGLGRHHGLGLTITPVFGLQPVPGLTTTVVTAPAPSAPGLSPAVTANLKVFLTELGKPMGASDPSRGLMLMAGNGLGLLRPTASGMIDPAGVSTVLKIMPQSLRDFASQSALWRQNPSSTAAMNTAVAALQALGVNSINALVTDIDSGALAARQQAAAQAAQQAAADAAERQRQAQLAAQQAAAQAQADAQRQAQLAAQQAAAQQAAAQQAAAQAQADAEAQRQAQMAADQAAAAQAQAQAAQATAQAAADQAAAAQSRQRMLYVGAGVVGLGAVAWYMTSRSKVTPNRRRMRRNRRRNRR